jgi:F-type H+-transporting ATPase subunit delta
MAEHLTIARPYAKAVFAQASATETMDGWENALQSLALAVKNPELSHLLDNPKVSDTQFYDLLMEILQKTLGAFFSQHKTELSNFIKLLIFEKRLNVLPEILSRYQTFVMKAKQLKEVTVISAFPIDQKRRHALTEALTKHLKSKLSITFQENNELIGGVIIRSGNWVMDNSIKSRLENLQKEIL